MDWLASAKEAQVRITPYLGSEPTPLLRSRVLSERAGRDVFLKLETRQPTGAYKVRPALNGILANEEAARRTGVLTTSSGNYAQAVAWAARTLGIQACIVMTSDTAPYKVERTRALGAEVIFCGTTFESRFETVEKLQKERQCVVLHGFDSIETIAGDGTIALELVRQLGELEASKKSTTGLPLTVLAPASGGGMISGIAAVLKTISRDHRIVGFQPERGGAIAKSLQAGERINVGKVNTIADALVASIPGEQTFKLIQTFCDGFHLVSEPEIQSALRYLIEEEKLWVEAGGAVSTAGLIQLLQAEKLPAHRGPVVCILSGGNLDPALLNEVLSPPQPKAPG